MIAGGLDDGTIKTASQAIAMEDKANANWIIVDLNRRSTIVVRPDGKGGIEPDWTKTVAFLQQPENTEGVPFDIVKGLRANAQSQATIQKRRDDQAIENAQSEQRDNIYEMIEVSSADTIDTINRSDLTGKEKTELRKLARNPDVAFNFTEYNNVVDIIDGVAKGTHTMKQADDAIAGGVGKHFDATIARSLRSKLSEKSKADSPLNKPQAKRGQALIARLRTQNLKLAEEDESLDPTGIELQYFALQNDFDEWLIDNSDATDADIEKKVRTLTEPVVEEVTLGFLDRVITGFFRAGKGKFDKALVDKKIGVLEERGIWKTLNTEDKESAKQALQRGVTVQQIIDNL